MFHYELVRFYSQSLSTQELDSGGGSVYTRFRDTVLSELPHALVYLTLETVDKEYVSSYVKTVENSSHYTDYTNNSNVNISAPIGFDLQEGFINIGHILLLNLWQRKTIVVNQDFLVALIIQRNQKEF